VSHSWKVRHRDKLVAATKQPICQKKLGLPSNECLTAKDRQERTERYQRHRLQSDADFHKMARREPERLPLGRTPLEQIAIDAFSDVIAARIVQNVRNAPIAITLIPKDMKHGTRTKNQCRYAPIRITSFAALVAAFSEREARDQA
jgi:hypothetical protein